MKLCSNDKTANLGVQMSCRCLKAFSLSLCLIGLALIGLAAAPGASAQQSRFDYLLAPESSCPNQLSNQRARMINVIYCMTNYARAKQGLPRYQRNNKLNWSARRKSDDLYRCNEFAHSACKRRFDYWIDRSKYKRSDRSWLVGENIAWGSGSYSRPLEIFRAWIYSTGHRRAILSRS